MQGITFSLRLHICWILVLGLFSGCGTTVNTSFRKAPPLERTPNISFRVPGSEEVAKLSPDETARALVAWAGHDVARQVRASQLILQQARSRPVARTSAAAGFALTAARLAWDGLKGSGTAAVDWPTSPATQDALRAYNSAVSIFVELTKDSLVVNEPRVVATPTGPVKLAIKFPQHYPLGFYDRLLLSDQINITGFRNRITVNGLGVALVGIREQKKDRAAEMALFPSSGVASALGCVVRFDQSAGEAQVMLVDSKHRDRAEVGTSKVTLSADYTAPLAFSFGGANDLLLGIRNFLNVGVGTSDAGIYLGEPFDPTRIPVLLIHGLSSSPIVWRNVANESMRDPEIRRNFQFLYAYYSTGAPVTSSAALIKDDVLLIRKTYGGSPTSRGSTRLSMVGYSMGGVIAQILVTDVGDRLWNTISKVPFDQIKFDPADIPDIRKNIFWTPVKDVQQVVFIATPHRGTNVANVSYARFADWLIRLPSDFVQFQRRIVTTMGDALQGVSLIGFKITGLDGLSTKSPIFVALDGLPFEKGVRYYSIIGDRGRGDSPNSSDGIVEYWSSHLAGAESELIVPTGHDAQAHPKSEQEIIRILNEDLKMR